MLYSLVRPLLFSLDPEAAHNLTMSSLSLAGKLTLPMPFAQVEDSVEVMGLTFKNRVGLAAGLDKNAEAVLGLQGLGFGFLELGTVTPLGQAGNPKPRMFRLLEHDAVINRMGFNNHGLESFLSNLKRARETGRVKVPVGVNLGKNKNTPAENAADDYVTGLRGAAELADYITINLSSPNTPGLRDLQFGDALKVLLERISEERSLIEKSEKRLPLLIKLAPDMADDDLISVAALACTLGIDGLIISNTTIERSAVTGHKHAEEAGGLSGAPVFEASTRALKVVSDYLTDKDNKLVLIGVGGIDSPEKAQAKIDAGADLVQVYSGMVYQGPGLVGRAAKSLKQHVQKQ